jgi:Plasmid rolling circle replication initiator protein and truncated derivatives
VDFSNEVLEEMQKRKFNYNNQYSKWYIGMHEEFKNSLKSYSGKLKGRADRINNCLTLWQWDLYRRNKLMVLQKVNRCMNNRFCPNCRKWDLAGAIHNFKKPLNDLLLQGYYPYLVTLYNS